MCQDVSKKKVTATIISNKEITDSVYEMVFKAPQIAIDTKPGQFLNMYCKSDSTILPRPISICEVNREEGLVKVVYAVVGNGTKEFSTLVEADEFDVLGPLGNGFNIEEDSNNIIVGGGVGTPPLLELVKSLKGNITVYLGFRTNPYLIEEFKKYTDQVYVATDDGSVGHKGNVVELMETSSANGQMIYACGPKPMLNGLKEWAEKKNVKAQLSLEERMGCGIGACVGCVCKVKADTEVGYTYKKVCKDGPVFWAEEVIL